MRGLICPPRERHLKSTTIASYQDLIATIRARRDELNLPHEAIDALSGLAEGYTSKLLAATPIKYLGPVSWHMLEALGLRIIVREDRVALERARRSHMWRTRKVQPWCSTSNGLRPPRKREAA